MALTAETTQPSYAERVAQIIELLKDKNLDTLSLIHPGVVNVWEQTRMNYAARKLVLTNKNDLHEISLTDSLIKSGEKPDQRAGQIIESTIKSSYVGDRHNINRYFDNGRVSISLSVSDTGLVKYDDQGQVNPDISVDIAFNITRMSGIERWLGAYLVGLISRDEFNKKLAATIKTKVTNRFRKLSLNGFDDEAEGLVKRGEIPADFYPYQDVEAFYSNNVSSLYSFSDIYRYTIFQEKVRSNPYLVRLMIKLRLPEESPGKYLGECIKQILDLRPVSEHDEHIRNIIGVVRERISNHPSDISGLESFCQVLELDLDESFGEVLSSISSEGRQVINTVELDLHSGGGYVYRLPNANAYNAMTYLPDSYRGVREVLHGIEYETHLGNGDTLATATQLLPLSIHDDRKSKRIVTVVDASSWDANFDARVKRSRAGDNRTTKDQLVFDDAMFLHELNRLVDLDTISLVTILPDENTLASVTNAAKSHLTAVIDAAVRVAPTLGVEDVDSFREKITGLLDRHTYKVVAKTV